MHTSIVTAIALVLGTTDARVVVVHPASTLVSEWEGWGTSLCWWANAFGSREDLADALFTLNESVSLGNEVATSIPGLGMTIARYNFGGSGSRSFRDDHGQLVSMNKSSAMPEFKAIEAFWQDPISADPDSTSWNWSLDTSQRQALLLAKARGATTFEAFSNSPPWWMTRNLATAGGESGSIDNLSPSYEKKFAWFMATAVVEFKKRWNVEFQYVEPFNEPSSKWWTYPDTQEGCHFSIDTQKRVVRYIRQYLDELTLSHVGVSASDENSPTLAYESLVQFVSSPSSLEAIAKVNTHGYQGGVQPYRGPYRAPLHALASAHGKKLWDSEYGENDATGSTLAQSIALDINEMRVSAFVYWQALDGGGWGLIRADPGATLIQGINLKYFILAQFTRHIRPGMRVLDTTDFRRTVAAIDSAQSVLALISINVETEQDTVEFDLAGFEVVDSSVQCWTTASGSSIRFYEHSYTQYEFASDLLVVMLPPRSVMTCEVRVA